jgi:AcrR family transcriptional regulator
VPAVARTAAQRDRRQRILAAARGLLEDRDYDRIQMRDVADRAEVALGTLYRYFPSKEQLFAHALLDWSESFETAMRRTGAEPASDAERMERALRRTMRAFERNPNYFRLIGVLEVVDDEEAAAAFRAYRRRFESVMVDSIDDLDPADARVVTAMLSTYMGGLLRAWSRGELPLRAVHESIERAVRLVLGRSANGG